MEPSNIITTNCIEWFTAINNWFQSKLGHFLDFYRPKMIVYEQLTPCKEFAWHGTIKYHLNQLYWMVYSH